MPTVAFKSRVRTSSDYSTLTLIIRHRLVVGQPSKTVHDMKLSLPEGVDILLGSPLSVTISGMLNGGRIPPERLVDSRIAHHLVQYLRMNADELGMNAVSNARISEDTGFLTFSCTSSRPLPRSAESLPVHSHLIGFDIDYVWQTNAVASQSSQAQIAAAMNPFSRQLSLPFLTIVNSAVERLVTFQLVRRYPLIFGYWCKQLDTERLFFTSIFASIVHIAERSPNPDFQDKFKELLKLFSKRIGTSSTAVTAALSDYLGPIESSKPWTNSRNEEESFVLSMEGFYRLGLKRPLFKGLSNFCIANDTEAEALLDELPALPENSEFETDSQFDAASPSHAGGLQVLIPHMVDNAYHSDSFDYLENFPEHDSFSRVYLDSLGRDKDGQCSFYSRHAGEGKYSGSENLNDIVGLEDDVDMLDFSRHIFSEVFLNIDDLTNGVYDNVSADSDLDYPEIYSTLPLISHRDWSPDIDTSQEKSNRSSMGVVFAPNDAEAQPHKLPSPCLPRTALGPSDYESRAGSSSPCLDYDSDCANGGGFPFAAECDYDILQAEAQSEDARARFDLQYDSGCDDHGLIAFEREPNSVILTFRNASTKTLSTISPREASLSDHIINLGPVEHARMDETPVNADRQDSELATNNFGILLVF